MSPTEQSLPVDGVDDAIRAILGDDVALRRALKILRDELTWSVGVEKTP